MEKSNLDDAPFTVLSETRKKWTITMASLVTFLSPVSSSIYYPALNPLAHDLHVSLAQMGLTITVFMIVQGLGPMLVASFSDMYGRRPVVIVGLLLYLAIDIGLARQTSYPVLMALRCLQSLGSSTASMVCSSVPADLVPRSERGQYMIYSSLGVTLGPAVGPIVGGILTQFLGWRANFWFLALWAAIMIILFLVFVPETCRAVVGNGSIPPARWNRSLVQHFNHEAYFNDLESIDDAKKNLPPRVKRPSPLDVLKVAAQKETCALITFTTIQFCGYVAILSSLPSQLEHKYQFNALQVGLCYIPYGVGVLTARWTLGKLIDWNFRRHAKKQGIEIVRNRQVQMISMPVEKARLQITLPAIYCASLFMIGYAWTMNYPVPLVAPLILLFLIAHLISGCTSTLITLMVDCHVRQPATVTSANNLFRSLCGAGAVAGAVPLIDLIGIGWTGTIIGFVWVVSTPILWGIYFWGHDYRRLKEACNSNSTINTSAKN